TVDKPAPVSGREQYGECHLESAGMSMARGWHGGCEKSEAGFDGGVLMIDSTTPVGAVAEKAPIGPAIRQLLLSGPLDRYLGLPQVLCLRRPLGKGSRRETQIACAFRGGRHGAKAPSVAPVMKPVPIRRGM